jgi:RNA-binding protein
MPVTEKQRRWLKAQAHHLKPVVLVGQSGVTQGVLAELDGALAHHELLKTKIAAGDRELRDACIAELLAGTGALLVHRIGNVAVLFRANPKKPSPIALPAD